MLNIDQALVQIYAVLSVMIAFGRRALAVLQLGRQIFGKVYGLTKNFDLQKRERRYALNGSPRLAGAFR
jgi:hypothetical protein